MSSTHSGEIKNDEGNPIPVTGTVIIVPSGTQDVNIVSTITLPVSGPLTDTELRAVPVPVSGTVSVSNFPAVQPVSGPLTDTELRATPVPISGAVTALPSGTQDVNLVSTITVPISAVSLPLPTGASTEAKQTQPGVDIGDVTVNNGSGAGAVNIQDGGNTITVDGTVAATQSGTWTTARSWTLSTATDSVSVNPVVSSSVSVTRVATSTTPNTIAANASRKQLMIDTEAGIHYVLLGAGTVSSTNYSVQLTANSYYEVPPMWTGVVSLVKSTGTGNAQITEIS